MIAHKHISKIIAAVMAFTVCLCVMAVGFSGQINAYVRTGISMEYETALFDTNNIMNVNILMDKTDWDEMLKNAISEEYYQCNAEINGKTFYRVAIRPKGNTSLTSIANDPDTDRYSFKLEFDHYVEGQTCFGLDKLILNNNFADATNMKEALIYDMYHYLGADASLSNYAKISVNGEYWGIYHALEAVEDSFMLRNYGVKKGELYKPESMGMGGGDKGGKDPGGMAPESVNNKAEKGFFGGKMGGFSMGGGGADLNYSDDDLDSYLTIWDGEITSTKKADRKRVVTALKNISEGTELETYMDTDNLLRYMAVHIFSVNEDSLSGMMAHNYYLYESDGKLNLIPWDYNLALGGMGGGSDASSVVNDPIDNAFSGTNFFDTLMADENYHSDYYAYMQKLTEYISSGGFDAFYERVRSQIDELVKTDPTAFYSYDEYLTAVDTLYQTVKLRGGSIQGQLDGSIPSTSDGQRSSDTLLDASSLDLSTMGSMNGGGFGGRSEGKEKIQAPDPSVSETDTNNNVPQNGRPSGGDFPGQMSSSTQSISTDNAITLAITFSVLAAAMLFAVLYRRKPRKK